jgi:hypothetical protein
VADRAVPRVGAWRFRVAARAEALPVWLWLGGVVALSAVVRFVLALGYPSPWTWTDELLYAELAKSFAATGHFAVREIPGTGGFGVVYPVLLSPAYALFTSVPAAYTAMKAINCLVMSLAAVPTYFLARRLVGRWLALTAGLLAVAIPGLTYTAAILTENAFYPAFLFWCWGTIRALEAPTVRRQLTAIALLGIAYLTRPQAVMLVPALVTAVLLVTALDAWAAPDRPFARALWRSARRYLTIWLTLALAVCFVLAREILVKGRSLDAALLGPYSSLSSVHYTFTNVSHWFVYHVGELDFSLGVIPFAALLLVVFAGLRPSEASRELRVFAAVALPATFWIVLGVSAFATTPFAGRIEERDMFYVDPLFLVALVVCVGRGLLWRMRTPAALAALVAVGCVAAVPFGAFLDGSAANDAFALLPLSSVLDRHFVGGSQLQGTIVAGAVLAAAIFLVAPRRFGLVLPGVVLLTFVLANGPVHRRTSLASTQSKLSGVQAKPDWIDRAVGTKPEVAVLWSARASYGTLWDNEFFNRSVGKVYNFFGPPDGLPEENVALQPSGAVTYLNRPVRATYMLTDASIILAGKPVARDEGVGMTVYRVGGPVLVRGQLEGIYPDLWSGPAVTYVEYHCTGGTVTVRLTGDPGSHPFAQTITATVGTRQYTKVVRPGQFNVPFSVPVVPDESNVCRIAYAISPTAIPDQTIHNGDTRVLGIRFVRVTYRPPNGPPVSNH